MNKIWVQGISIGFVVIMVANMILFALGRISGLMMWFIVALGALVAYVLLPRIR